jgi:hypothetical protein
MWLADNHGRRGRGVGFWRDGDHGRGVELGYAKDCLSKINEVSLRAKLQELTGKQYEVQLIRTPGTYPDAV